MYIQLLHRHRNVQRPVKGLWLPCRLEQAARPDGGVDEGMLLSMIPEGWLPAKPEEILVSVAHRQGSTGLRNLSRFRPWARHFDCYVLELWHEEPR